MIKEAKQPNHVTGNRFRCPNFKKCPLCYGCRAYSTHDLNCLECVNNKKRDICNKDLHRDDLIDKFITKDKIEFEGAITFESNIRKEE